MKRTQLVLKKFSEWNIVRDIEYQLFAVHRVVMVEKGHRVLYSVTCLGGDNLDVKAYHIVPPNACHHPGPDAGADSGRNGSH